MVEKRVITIAKVVTDECWARRELWAEDGSGYNVPQHDLHRCAERWRPDGHVFLLVGLRATFELVEGRWLLARLDDGIVGGSGLTDPRVIAMARNGG